MELTLGRMRGDIISIADFRNIAFGPIEGQVFQLERAREVFTWDCANRQGNPNPRRPSIRPSNSVMFAFPDRRGSVDQITTEEMLDDILDLAGLANTRALVAAINDEIPPPRFEIDYSELADPFLEDYSFRIVALVSYLQCIYRPRGLMTGDHFFVFVPHLATFRATVTGRCTGTLPDSAELSGWSPNVVREPSLATLEAEVLQHELEARRRLAEILLPNFTEPQPPGPLDPSDPDFPTDPNEDEDKDEQEDESEDPGGKKTKSRGKKKRQARSPTRR